MKIAIIGSGIAGLSAASALHNQHDITVFERSDWVGGHAHTVDLEVAGERLAVDTGFMVCNRKTYPTFLNLIQGLGVELQETDMSFGVSLFESGLEYAAAEGDPWALLANPTNILRPGFHRMLRDTVRFYRRARAMTHIDPGLTLGDFLDHGRYSAEFVDWHMLPMTAAVWSSGTGDARDFPLRTLVHFFDNHGFLQLRDRPRWLTMKGGSRAYVRALSAPFRERIRLRCQVERVSRRDGGVRVESTSGLEQFDRVVFACHAPDALALLADSSEVEQEILSAIPYTVSEVVLHSDERLMPRRRRAWASWNYRVSQQQRLPTVTYWMNRLQRLPVDRPLLVTLNGGEQIAKRHVIERYSYAHPLFSRSAIAAQARHSEIDGVRNTHYCGAYWGYGFHEDGAKSGLAVAEAINGRSTLSWAS